MILFDVNILVYTHREDAPKHTYFRQWLEKHISSGEGFGYSEVVLSGFIRVVTHPRIFSPPTPIETALRFVEDLRRQPNAILIAPGDRHWNIFADLCRNADAKGNLVADAYLAALAIESGCEWVTTDRDYHRFRGLKYRILQEIKKP